MIQAVLNFCEKMPDFGLSEEAIGDGICVFGFLLLFGKDVAQALSRQQAYPLGGISIFNHSF